MHRVSQILLETREMRGFSLSFVAKQTHIRVEHLRFIEEGQWNKLASYPYALGMVNTYAKFLELDEKKISAMFRREIENSSVQFIRSSDYHERRSKTATVSKNTFLIIFLGLVVTFFSFQLVVFLQKPLLEIRKTPSRISADKPLVITGYTAPNALLYLNDQRLYQNDKGEFKQELYLKKGKRTVVLKAIGQNGRTETNTIEVVVE